MSENLLFMLIDDDEDDQEFFTLALEESSPDISCVVAGNGIEGLHMLHSGMQLPDIIFLDLNMPMMGGKECLIELKRSELLKHIPVVIYSTTSDSFEIGDLLNLGAEECVSKPAKLSEVSAIQQKFATFTRIHSKI